MHAARAGRRPASARLAVRARPGRARDESGHVLRLRYESEFDAQVEERYDGAVGVSTEDPARAWARGTTVYRVIWPEAEVRTEARLDLRSDAHAYHVVVDVVAEELGGEIDSASSRRERRFERTIPRRLQ